MTVDPMRLTALPYYTRESPEEWLIWKDKLLKLSIDKALV